MVDSINTQAMLTGAILASDIEQTSKEKKLHDKKAFDDELQKAEKLKQSQIDNTKEAETENRIREEEEQKEGQRKKQGGQDKKEDEPSKSEEDLLNDVPQPANPKLLIESEHEIDLEA